MFYERVFKNCYWDYITLLFKTFSKAFKNSFKIKKYVFQFCTFWTEGSDSFNTDEIFSKEFIYVIFKDHIVRIESESQIHKFVFIQGLIKLLLWSNYVII